jgi:hypothetical protein
MRAIDFISELYEPESSFPLNWYPSHHPNEASARAYDRNKGYIDIKFTPILDSDDMVEVEFSRNDSYDMTGGGDANRVLGTVLQAFREYLQGYQPKILLFSAKGSSRSKVYQNLIKRFASTVGYKQFDISKLSPETQEKIAFSGSDLMVLRKTINELNHAPAIDEMAGDLSDLKEAMENWQTMYADANDIATILNHPYSQQFKRPPAGIQRLYRGLMLKGRSLKALSGKSNRKLVAYATNPAGAHVFLASLDLPDEQQIIIEKQFNPGDFLLDYTALYESVFADELGPFSRYEPEYEVWMRATPYYTSVKEEEIVD